MNSAGTQEATERLTGLGLAYLGNMSVDDMLEATAYIGAPLSTRAGGPLVDLLRPHDRHSKGATFSDLYGFGAFPWHTDGAVDPYPPKYLALRLASPGPVEPTLLLDGLTLFNAQTSLRDAIRAKFLLASPYGTRIVSLAERSDICSAVRLRFDPRFMRPCNGLAHRLVGEIAKSSAAIRLEWNQTGDVWLFDNSRFLHARPNIISVSRMLERISLR